MTEQEGDRKPGNEGALHCLECGAVLPEGAESCVECGNERLILPDRWDPPGESRPRPGNGRLLGREARVLVGLTFALFIALGLLSGARARNAALMNGESSNDMQIVVDNSIQQDTDLPSGDTMLSDEPMGEDIGTLRAAATQLAESGALYDAADAWTRVTAHPEAVPADFLALARAWEHAGDPDAAQAALSSACVRFPENPGGYLAMGEFLESRGNHNAAMLQYQLGLTYSENDPDLMSGLFRCEERLGLIEEPETDEEETEMIADSEPEVDIQPEPELETPEVVPPAPIEPEQNEPIAITLIGSGSNMENIISGAGESAQVEGIIEEEGEEEIRIPVEIIDLQIEATPDTVTVTLTTDRPAQLISSQADDPPRLVIRLPGARVRPGANVATSATLNTPLVERVNLIETSADNYVVLLVIYLGQETRYTVASDATTVRVNIGRSSGG